MAETMRLELRCYRFVCPQCGVSERELGYLASEDEIHCMVCLVDENSAVRLRRWLDEAAAA